MLGYYFFHLMLLSGFVSWVPVLVSSFPCVPRSVVSGSLRSPFHSLRVPRGMRRVNKENEEPNRARRG